MKSKIIAQGAEAIIIQEGDNIIKDRVIKTYRHPELDKKIRKQRTSRETKLLERASKIINSPKPEEADNINQIKMPLIQGKKLSENLEKLDWKSICKQIGNSIAKLHDNNIIHGDLTTSNMIWVENPEEDKTTKSKNQEQEAKIKLQPNQTNKKLLQINNKNGTIAEQEEAIDSEIYPKLYFIDFGLGFTSERIEDRAVDLHLIKQALEAKHFTIYKEAEKIILDNYASKDKKKVLEQLKKVEARGRYKH